VKAQRDFTERNSLKEEQKNIENKLYVDKILGEYREKLNEQIKKLKDLREEHRRASDTYNRVFQEWDDLKVKTKTKNLLKEITENLEGEVGSLRENHFNDNNQKLTNNKKKLEEADAFFRYKLLITKS
jgi:hypothetical protein